MKENIKALLPNPFAVEYVGADEPMDIYTEEEMLEFAEKIIRDCIRQIQLDIPRSGFTSENKRSVMHIQKLKEYFGVSDE